jgi:hypothetical protein
VDGLHVRKTDVVDDDFRPAVKSVGEMPLKERLDAKTHGRLGLRQRHHDNLAAFLRFPSE